MQNWKREAVIWELVDCWAVEVMMKKNSCAVAVVVDCGYSSAGCLMNQNDYLLT